MPVDARLVGYQSNLYAKITAGGALAVSPLHPSVSFNGLLGTDATVVNVVPAKSDHVFHITGVFLTGNKDINTSVDAVVEVYTGTSDETTAANATTNLFTVPVGRSSSSAINPILVETSTAEWINAVTSDDDVYVTILGYYLKVVT
jgi:hypothetical protein